jgi:signal transduction histidine kinase
MEHFAMRIRELTARGCDDQRHSRRAAVGGAALTKEFRTRLSAIRTASAALRDEATLPPEQREMVASVEEESARLSLLARRLMEMLPAENSRSCLPRVRKVFSAEMKAPRRRAVRR